jgi:lipoprotein-releasing system permease protein
MKQFEVAGFFKSGLYEYDTSFAYIHLKDAQKMLRTGDSVTGIEVRIDDIFKARKIADSIDVRLGLPYRAQDWMQLNRSLFQAMKTERRVMFIILTLTILVATFSIASTLIMLVIGKTRDIAILKAMGATNKSIRKIFVFNGMVIGVIGTGLGLILGLALSTILQHYDITHLTGDIYYLIDTVPVKLEILDVISIISATLGICFLATLYPARQAAKINPADSIRYS